MIGLVKLECEMHDIMHILYSTIPQSKSPNSPQIPPSDFKVICKCTSMLRKEFPMYHNVISNNFVITLWLGTLKSLRKVVSNYFSIYQKFLSEDTLTKYFESTW